MSLNPFSQAYGIDVGDKTLKVVQVLRSGRKNPTYRLVAWGQIELPEASIENGEILNKDEVTKRLSELIAKAEGRLKGRAAVACLPEAKSFIKIIDQPVDASNEEISKAIMSELEMNIPLPIGDIYHDWQKMKKTSKTARKVGRQKDAQKSNEVDEPTESKAEEKIRILIGAAPRVTVDSYVEIMEGSGSMPIGLEIEATAICRAIVPDASEDNQAIGILDIGAARSALIIYDDGAIQMSISIPISGHAITKLVSESLKVSMEDAEVLKRECGLDMNRCEDKMWNILSPLIDDITEKIRNALRFYKIGFPSGKKIETLYLCGGGALFREIDTVLSRKLAIKVLRADPLVNLSSKFPRKFPKDEALAYTTAIGLAIRATDELAAYNEYRN